MNRLYEKIQKSKLVKRAADIFSFTLYGKHRIAGAILYIFFLLTEVFLPTVGVFYFGIRSAIFAGNGKLTIAGLYLSITMLSLALFLAIFVVFLAALGQAEEKRRKYNDCIKCS